MKQQQNIQGQGLVDTRVLGKPDKFSGGIENRANWFQWARVLTAYCTTLRIAYGPLMKEAETRDTPILSPDPSEQTTALSVQLYMMLIMLLKEAALETLLAVEEGNGFEVYRLSLIHI